jgi:Fe-S-cluster-containing dehydrogenase component
MKINRRDFLKVALSGIASVSTSTFLFKKVASARTIFEKHFEEKEFMGILVDTTRCTGCRSCELACAEAHGLPIPDIEDRTVFNSIRNTSVKQWTVVNRFETEKGEVFVKKQCMHCTQPACVAACLVKAMKKREEGPVTWDENCMGCRYCMVSCPFDIPKFDYDKPMGTIEKCNMCYERVKEGKLPACVEVCPNDALIFGKRRDILHEAKKRLYTSPDRYIQMIYGEEDAGGTGYIYISKLPFERLGFKVNLGRTPYPEYTKDFLYAVPVILILWPAFLTGINHLTKKDKGVER